jgi:hypothetical protein
MFIQTFPETEIVCSTDGLFGGHHRYILRTKRFTAGLFTVLKPCCCLRSVGLVLENAGWQAVLASSTLRHWNSEIN